MSENQAEIDRLRAQVESLSKMAAMGELSAGIAHEIQNPLNFVLNFAKLSKGLLKDLEEVTAEETLSDDGRDNLEDILATLTGNLDKIVEHGERASSIVQNILLYIRGKEDEFILTDIPKLVKEYLLLSYHASRAQDKSFNVSFQEEYDPGLEAVSIIPQDFSRAVLNVFTNSFYAMKERYAQQGSAYKPVMTVRVKNEGDYFKVVLEDNGTGMTDDVKQALFLKYFTTKPVGEGTGLGLMLTKKIIEKKHKGTVLLESEYGHFTRFTFTIPLNLNKTK